LRTRVDQKKKGTVERDEVCPVTGQKNTSREKGDQQRGANRKRGEK